ncbi:MAG TPA: CinA family nicotinamide mononucleotide deamidase-related protein [Kofleriaceae bacterium]|jgi:nicotinamide-nucleotide amidase|nr:CinA family nicotinamide mononucleotide deamidase-related protein [Kofleriaceae bacterium]
MRAEILTIGDELCRGEIVDTNSSHLAARLWDLAITTRWMTSCTDDAADITSALAQAVARADLVVCSGGLGPTEDDLTVDVVAGLLGVPAVVDEPSRARLETWFAQRVLPAARATGEVGPGPIPVGAVQLRQVRVPAGARVHPNPAGLAPGFEVVLRGVPVLFLPGFPREIQAILEAGMDPRFAELREARGEVERIARRIYRVFGRGESQISQACRGMIDGVPGASIHYQVKFPETLVKLVVRDRAAGAAERALAGLDAEIRGRLRGFLYGDGDETLIDRAVRRLIEAGKTVATAESCTGGMIGELLTRRPGSSRAVLGGAIAYSNAEKVRQLGVREDTITSHGAVSEPTVREMALGARERFGSDLAIAVSGIAGPDGGTPDKPVGTVWLALAGPGADPGVGNVTTKMLAWPGARDQIRTLASWWALRMIDEAI